MIPDALNVTACRSCRAPIVWARTVAGKLAPIDVEPAENGNVVFLDDNRAETLGPLELELLDPDRARFLNHFATCPDADTWKGGRS
jgi:hypothetical protein